MELSVIIRTRGTHTWLDKALTGFALQASRAFEVIVADEAAARSTAELVAGRRQGFPVPLRHVRAGVVPGRTLAAAIALAGHDYVLLTSADCIPARDLVAMHAALAARGRFLSGECCRLDGELAGRISRNDIVRGRCFDPDWLQAHGPLPAGDRRLLTGTTAAARLLEAVSPTSVPFNPRNGSAWKDDLLQACGDAAWDGAAAGRRLAAAGVRGRRIRRQGVCLELGRPGPAAEAPAPAQAHAAAGLACSGPA